MEARYAEKEVRSVLGLDAAAQVRDLFVKDVGHTVHSAWFVSVWFLQVGLFL